MSSRHARPTSKTAVAWGSAVIVMALLLLVSVLAATSFARPDHNWGPPVNASDVFGNIVKATAGLKADANGAQSMKLTPRTPVKYVTDFSGPQSIKVKAGQTLSSIAKLALGKSSLWPILWWDNRSKVPNPNVLRAGIRLHFGTWHRVRPWLAKKALAAASPVSYAPANSAQSSIAPVAYAPSGGGILSYGQLEALWVSASGPSWAEAAAATVAECESGGNPNAYNPSGASGIWQILGQVVAGNIFNPMVNALNAVAKFHASGDTFAQWVCQP